MQVEHVIGQQEDEVLDLLGEFIGPTIDKHYDTHPRRCIMATTIGLRVASNFGLRFKPVSVNVLVGNEEWAAWYVKNRDVVGASMEGYAVGVHHMHSQAHIVPGGWPGHLVMGNEFGLVDLDFRQFARPQHDLYVPDTAMFAFEDGDNAGEFYDGHVRGAWQTEQDGHIAYVMYEHRPQNDDWLTAGDWTDQSQFEPCIRDICRQIGERL